MFALRLFLFTFFAISAVANTYYVSRSGDDNNDGGSITKAWKSVSTAHKSAIHKGDKLLFEGGASFAENLALSFPEDHSTNETYIGSFGKGNATLHAGVGSGLVTTNVGNLIVENLVIEGNGSQSNAGFGVLCENSSTNSMLENLTLRHLDIHGFGKQGLIVTGKEYGFKHVRVKDCLMHDDRKGGIEIVGRLSWESKHYAHADVVVRRCQAYDNSGDPLYTQSHSGSGIVLYQVDGGMIESCAAWNNGALCPARGGGPVGIWTCAARNVVIAKCESFNNKTCGLDGGGFDIDGGCENCVLEYSYSHDNIGPGLMVYTYPYGNYTDRGNVVRFNVSINDGIKSDRYAGLWIRADGRKMKGLSIYNNTVITSGRYAAVVFGQDVEARLQNNLFITSTNGTPVEVDGGHSLIKLQNNAFWRNGATFNAIWNQKNYESLADWESATKEKEFYTDPHVTSGETIAIRGLPGLSVLRPHSAELLTNGLPVIPTESKPPSADILSHQFAGPARPIGAMGEP